MATDPELILEGRTAAMRALRDALSQARAGRGRLVLVSGDAGIGKSAIAAALGAEAQSAGAEVVWGRAWEFADAPPYFPVRPALRAVGIDPHAAGFREDGGAFRLWESVVEALARAKTEVVWILEDLHAADLLTLDLLTFLAQAARGLRLLVLGTTRAKDPHLDERASQRLSRMARDGIDLRLTPLSQADVGAVAARVCGRALPPTVVRELAELTGGNPLFVVECARAFESSGTIKTVPHNVRQVVLGRFAGLPESTRNALESGAVLGREFTAALVGRMQKLLPARVIDDVLPALHAGLVGESGPGRFVFSHVIVRDTIEDSLSAANRARIHGLAETALEASGSSVDVTVERARHALAASTLGDGQRAVDLARRAIKLLEADGAHDRAYAICERVAAASAESEVGSLLTMDDWMDHARIARDAGRYAESKRACERLIDEAGARGDAGMFARAALLAGADLRPAIVDRSLVALLEEAQRRLGDSDPILACRVQARLAAALQPHDDVEVPIAIARDAMARARSLPDAILLDVLDIGVAALVDYAPVSERRAIYEEILTRATKAGDLPRVLRSYARLAMDHAFVGDFDAFSRDVDTSLRIASEMGHPRYGWRPLLLSSMRAIANGDFTESERALVEVSQLAALTDDPALTGSFHAHRFHRTLVLQREDELRAMVAELAQLLAPFGELIVQALRTAIFARLEDEVATRGALAAMSTAAFAFLEREISGVALLAEPIALAGNAEHRRRALALLEPHSALEAIGGHMPVSYDGPVARSVGILHASLGNLTAAETFLTGAVELAKVRGHRTWVAQMTYDLARVLGSRAHAEAAADLATELGMDGLAEKARRRATGASKQASTGKAPPIKATLALVNEGDVWQVSHGDRSIRVRDSRGMQLLARLVERGDEEIHVLALASDEGGPGVTESSAGEVLDEQARRAYRERLTELAGEIDDAEQKADAGRLAKARREKAMLEDELGRAIGLGGRSRKECSATERARVNVQRRIKDAILRIQEVDADVGRFLARAVRTGTFCCFRP